MPLNRDPYPQIGELCAECGIVRVDREVGNSSVEKCQQQRPLAQSDADGPTDSGGYQIGEAGRHGVADIGLGGNSGAGQRLPLWGQRGSLQWSHV